MVSLFLFVAFFCSLSLQQDITYIETPLPNKSSISVGKRNGVVWPIAIIGTFSLSQSYTGPDILFLFSFFFFIFSSVSYARHYRLRVIQTVTQHKIPLF
jgi:hypothetical protein